MSRCSRFHGFFAFLELNLKKKGHRLGLPRALRVVSPEYFARFWGQIWWAVAHVGPGDRFPFLYTPKSENHLPGQAGPRRQRKKVPKMNKKYFGGFENSVTSDVLPVWRGCFSSVPRAPCAPMPRFSCVSAMGMLYFE